MPNPVFEFNSTAVADNYFSVVSFRGTEAISRLYEFEIELKAPVQTTASATFLDDVLAARAEFIMEYDAVAYPVYGMLAQFDEMQTAGNFTYYKAVLVPGLWQLTLSRNSRVYTTSDSAADADGMTVLDILGPILDEYQLDYETGDVTGTLLTRPYRCQFNESAFDFISRLLENEGIFYYFEHSDTTNKTEKIIFSDGTAGDDFSANPSLLFDASPPANKVYESVNAWLCRKKRMPGKVMLESYDFSSPSDDVSSEYAVNASNLEDQYSFGENITMDEADTIAQIRAEEISVMDTQYFGESGVCGLRAGYTFDINGHRNTLFNDVSAYVITEIHHEGQTPAGTAGGSSNTGIQNRLSGQGQAGTSVPQYTNSFTAIDNDVQFRPQRLTAKPRFYGTITAFVYSADGGNYAYVNENGHYRVTLPFRRFLDTAGERATHWIRMAQPYHGIIGGVSEGMCYPLMDGTEVLLTFINGDPDRPVISATVPNESAPSLVKTDANTDNSHQTVYSTHGMYKEDVRGGNTSIVGVKSTGERGNHRGNDNEDLLEFAQMNEDGSSTGQVLNEESGEYIVTRRYGNQYEYIDSTVFSYGGNYVKSYNFGCDYTENHELVEDDNSIIPSETFDMVAKMQSIGTLDNTDYSSWDEAANGFVTKSWGDTCEYQFGNSYNWAAGDGPGGAPRVYNYGNCYTENLLECDRGTAESNSLAATHDDYTSYSEIDPTIATIEKTFGNTYSYQNGATVDIQVGNSTSQAYGNSDETVTGNSTSTVTGNAVETVHGNADNKVMGLTSDMFLGLKNEMEVSGSNSMALGLKFELFIGGSGEINVAAGFEVNATKIKSNGMDVEAEITKLKAAGTDIKTSATKIDSPATEIKAGATSIKNTVVDIDSNALKMIG